MYKATCGDDNNNIDDNNDFFPYPCFVSRTFPFHMTSGKKEVISFILLYTDT